MSETRPVRYPPGYTLTPAGNAAAIRAELDDVTEDLVRFSQGGAPPEAISAAWDRMVELTRELRIVQPDEPRDDEDEWLRRDEAGDD